MKKLVKEGAKYEELVQCLPYSTLHRAITTTPVPSDIQRDEYRFCTIKIIYFAHLIS